MGGINAVYVLLATATSAATGGLSVEQQTQFVVENDYYRLVIDTVQGGAIRSFRYKPFDPNKEWIYPNGGGLLEDKIWQQQHPGELQDHPYAFKVLDRTPQVFRIEMWRAFQQPPYPGLMMRKVVTLAADSPAIHVSMTLENPTRQDMFPGAWIQNRFYCGGTKGNQTVYCPSYLGIRTASISDGRCTPGSNVFVRKPAGGWAMTFDPDRQVGLLFLVDYNYLQMHYACLPYYTTEFFYDRVLLRPGKSWASECLIVPVKNVTNCFYADRAVFATADRAGDTVTLRFRATDRVVAQAHVRIRAEKSDRSAVLAETAATLKGLTAMVPQPVSLTVPGVAKEPVIVTITVATGGKSNTFEFQYSPDPTFYQLQESAVTYRSPRPDARIHSHNGRLAPERPGRASAPRRSTACVSSRHTTGRFRSCGRLYTSSTSSIFQANSALAFGGMHHCLLSHGFSSFF